MNSRLTTLTVPCELPYGKKEIKNLEAYLLARIPKDMPVFGEEVGLGCHFFTQRGITNSSATWYWSKVRRALVEIGVLSYTGQAWVSKARITETVGDPHIVITIEEVG